MFDDFYGVGTEFIKSSWYQTEVLSSLGTNLQPLIKSMRWGRQICLIGHLTLTSAPPEPEVHGRLRRSDDDVRGQTSNDVHQELGM